MRAVFYKTILEHLRDGVYHVDRDLRITYWNSAAASITGYGGGEIVGRRCPDNMLRHMDDAGREICLSGCPLVECIKDGRARDAKVWLHHKDGHRMPIRVRISPVRDDRGEITGAVESFAPEREDRPDRAELARLKRLALLDPLTGLGNRRMAEQALDQGLEKLRGGDQGLGVLFLDIDGFKGINDAHGHPVGDRVLRMVANTGRACLRSGDMLFRWGGEELLALLPGVDARGLADVAERLRLHVEKSWLDHPEGRLGVTVSVGGTMARRDDGRESVVARADARMYEAKRRGRNCCVQTD